MTDQHRRSHGTSCSVTAARAYQRPSRHKHRIMRGTRILATLSALACASVHARPSGTTEFWGFIAPWDPRSTASATIHAQSLDAIVSGWIALDSTSFRPVALYPDTSTASTPRRIALVTSYQGSRFHPEILRAIAGDSTVLAHTAGAIATLATHYSSIILDLEGMTPADLPTLLAVTKSIADSAHAHNIPQVGLAIPATDTAAYPARPLLNSLDFLVVMLYDQHWLTSPPGPIAAPDWARRQLSLRVGEVGPAKLVAAYPVYGYQWRSDSATAVISYNDAKRLTAAANIPLLREPSSTTLHADTDTWHLWVSDAVLLDTLVNDAQTLGLTKFALWRLGLEDPAIWQAVVHH